MANNNYVQPNLFLPCNEENNDTLAESFYNIRYGSSIIRSKTRQKFSVMKTKKMMFPEK